MNLLKGKESTQKMGAKKKKAYFLCVGAFGTAGCCFNGSSFVFGLFFRGSCLCAMIILLVY
jgi:hypothetical protein